MQSEHMVFDIRLNDGDYRVKGTYYPSYGGDYNTPPESSEFGVDEVFELVRRNDKLEEDNLPEEELEAIYDSEQFWELVFAAAENKWKEILDIRYASEAEDNSNVDTPLGEQIDGGTEEADAQSDSLNPISGEPT